MAIPAPPPLDFSHPFLLPSLPSDSTSTSISKITNKYIGIYNQGATCYLNSLLQSLFMTPEFRYHLFQWKYNPQFHGAIKDSIPFQLQKLFSRLQNPIRDKEYTDDLTKSFGWSDNDVRYQHDIQELCRVLFEAIDLSLDSTDKNFINELYKGETKSVIQCLECNYQSFTSDTFLDLSLPILNLFENIHNKSLEMALYNFIKSEKLEKDNQYQCSKCNKKVDALKFCKFEKFPKILFIQLGRFYYNFATDTREKIHDRVPFPLILNLNKFMKSEVQYNSNESESDEFSLKDDEELIEKYLSEGEYVYELFSIVVQSGTANGGHYYAYIKSFEDNNWYNFNDSKVYELKKEEITKVFGEDNKKGSSQTGYCLMYRVINKNEKKFSIGDMKVNDVLMKEIKQENEIIIQRELKLKEEMNKMNISVYFKEVKKIIHTQRVFTFKHFKEQICKAFDIEKDNVDNFQLREYNYCGKKPLEYILEDDNTIIEKTNISSYKVYTLQFCNEDKLFPSYDPTLIELCLYVYNDNIKEFDNLESQPLTISYTLPMRELAKQIYDIVKCDMDKRDNVFILKKSNLGHIEKLNEIDKKELFSDKQILLCAFMEKTELFIECDMDNTINYQNSKWVNLYRVKYSSVKVNFTLIAKNSKQTIKLTLSQYDTIKTVKEKACKVFRLSPEYTILKLKENGDELNTESKKLEEYIYNSDYQINLYLEEGIPLKEDEVLITLVYCQTNLDVFNFFPYIFKEICKMVIKESDSIINVKSKVIEQLQKNNIQEVKEDFDINNLLIRAYSSGKPTKIYDDNSIIATLGFFHGIKIIAHIPILPIDKEGVCLDNENVIEITTRIFNCEKWELGPPCELLIDCNDKIELLGKKILNRYPQLESIENIQIVKVASGYNLNLDTTLMNNLTMLRDNIEFLIGSYPLFIKNDGYLLIVKDAREMLSMPKEESVKDSMGNNIPPPPSMVFELNNKPHIEISTQTETVKVTIKSQDKKQKPKEKGVTIKVKKINNENEKENEKEEEQQEKDKDNKDIEINQQNTEIKIDNNIINNPDLYPENDIEPIF